MNLFHFFALIFANCLLREVKADIFNEFLMEGNGKPSQDLTIDYNVNGKIKFHFGSEKKHNFLGWLAFLQYQLPLWLHQLPSTGAAMCPEPIPDNRPICAREGLCNDYYQCGYSELCCITPTNYDPCCVKTATSAERVAIPPTTNDQCPAPYTFFPNKCFPCEGINDTVRCSLNQVCCFSQSEGSNCCYDKFVAKGIVEPSRSSAEYTTGSTTESTTGPTTHPTTQKVPDCDIPSGEYISNFMHIYWCQTHKNCTDDIECCIGWRGIGCYDWPSRVPLPGTRCPAGNYQPCAILGEQGKPRSCNSANHMTVCQDSEICCTVQNSVEACCVPKYHSPTTTEETDHSDQD